MRLTRFGGQFNRDIYKCRLCVQTSESRTRIAVVSAMLTSDQKEHGTPGKLVQLELGGFGQLGERENRSVHYFVTPKPNHFGWCSHILSYKRLIVLPL